jgi:hypothetical protein
MTNPRDLIKRLTEKLDHLHCQYNVPNQSALVAEARAYLAQPEPTLTVEDCDNMHKHRFNFLYEDFTGEIVLDGSFTREDLIEIANTVPLSAISL